jgi:hypothetical protein
VSKVISKEFFEVFFPRHSRIFDLKAELTQKARKRKTNKTMHCLDKCLKKETKVNSIFLMTFHVILLIISQALKFWRKQQKFRVKKIKNQTKFLKNYQRNFHNRVKVRKKE